MAKVQVTGILFSSLQVQRNVDSCCKQLTLLFNEHKAACEAFDAAIVYHSATNNGRGSSAAGHHRAHSSSSVEAVGDAWTGAAGVAAAALHLAAGSSAGGGVLRPRFAAAPSRDPWASEGKLVIEQQALQKWQVSLEAGGWVCAVPLSSYCHQSPASLWRECRYFLATLIILVACMVETHLHMGVCWESDKGARNQGQVQFAQEPFYGSLAQA